MVKKKKKKRRIWIKFFIILLIVIFIFIFKIKSNFLNKIDFSNEGKITYYDIYGIHMNISGDFELNSKDSNPKLVLTNGAYEKVIKWNLKEKNNKYYFETSNYINDGINLEKLNKGTYYLLIKTDYEDTNNYYPLINETDYENLTYYTITKNSQNNKIEIIWDNYLNNELLKFSVQNTKLSNGVYDITIDPGHDGSDSGMIVCLNGSVANSAGKCSNSKSYKESDINFTVSKALKEELESMGYKVKLTRDNKDDTVATYGKMGSATTANAVKSKFNLAIHHNSTNIPGGMSSTHGFEVYVAGDSKFDLAKLFVKNIKTYGNASTSTKEEFKVQDGIYQRFSDDGITPYYYMIREVGGIATHAYVDGINKNYDENPYYDSNCTAEGYLFELGYIDNVKELKNILSNPKGYAKGIALAIDEYLKK